MPLVNVDVVKGRSPDAIRVLLDTIHEATVAALEVPDTDRYQILNQHEAFEICALDTSLGISRSDDLVMIRIISRERSEAAKTALYKLLSATLLERCGVSAGDLIVTVVENGPADWSFGDGKAQFLTGAL